MIYYTRIQIRFYTLRYINFNKILNETQNTFKYINYKSVKRKHFASETILIIK